MQGVLRNAASAGRMLATFSLVDSWLSLPQCLKERVCDWVGKRKLCKSGYATSHCRVSRLLLGIRYFFPTCQDLSVSLAKVYHANKQSQIISSFIFVHAQRFISISVYIYLCICICPWCFPLCYLLSLLQVLDYSQRDCSFVVGEKKNKEKITHCPLKLLLGVTCFFYPAYWPKWLGSKGWGPLTGRGVSGCRPKLTLVRWESIPRERTQILKNTYFEK